MAKASTDEQCRAVEVDAALAPDGQTWIPAEGGSIRLRPTGSAVVWGGYASGDVAVFGGAVHVGLRHSNGDVTMHNLACIEADP